MSVDEKIFNKENLDMFLKEVAKEYRKRAKNMPAEIILIGGAAVLANYGFRNMTTDIDAIINASSLMKDAINCIGDRFGLPNGWLNGDFKMTTSYTPKLIQYSKYYKTYSNILTVRTISAEYLIAMKLKSGRQYKNDLSDIIGILVEHQKRKQNISKQQVIEALENLYGSDYKLPEISSSFLEIIYNNENLSALYERVRQTEIENKTYLLQLQEKYPNAINDDNVNEIINNLNNHKQLESKSSIIQKIHLYTEKVNDENRKNTRRENSKRDYPEI